MSEIRSLKKDHLQVYEFATRKEMGEAAAIDIANAIRSFLAEKEEVNMVFAAAPSQNDVLAALCEQKEIEWERVNAFHMDEYVNLAPDSPAGFGNFLKEHIFGKLPFRSINYINGNAKDLASECKRYSTLLRQHPIDIVCLGIGENGHIAFNDPHVADFHDPEDIKVVDLDEICRKQQVHDGCFATLDEVPKNALTLTIPMLTSGQKLFCIVPAKTKAWAVSHTLNDEISEHIPATCLRLHKYAILYGDKDSMQLVK